MKKVRKMNDRFDSVLYVAGWMSVNEAKITRNPLDLST